MVTWEDIQTSLTDFWNWLTGIGGGLTDSLGELGSWLYGGIKWLADQFYNAWTYFSNWLYSGLQYLSDRFKEGYEAIAQWISGGLQWIGSGLSWIGQQLYSFGQWLWNGIVNTAITVANTIEGFINWIWEGIVNIYNDIVNYLASWVQGINDFLNDWIKSLRNKFKDLVLVNTTLPAIFKSFDMLTEGKLKEGILGMLISPFAGAIAGELLDVIVPRPHSERITFFPEFLFPTLTYTPITIEKPATPTTPIPTEIPSTPMYPPAVGYRPTIEKVNSITTLYEIYELGAKVRECYNSIGSYYDITTQEVTEVGQIDRISSEFELIPVTPLTASKFSKISSIYSVSISPVITKEKLNAISSLYNILTSLGSTVSKPDTVSSLYDISVITPKYVNITDVVSSLYDISVIAPILKTVYGSVASIYDIIVTMPELTVETMNKANSMHELTIETAGIDPSFTPAPFGKPDGNPIYPISSPEKAIVRVDNTLYKVDLIAKTIDAQTNISGGEILMDGQGNVIVYNGIGDIRKYDKDLNLVWQKSYSITDLCGYTPDYCYNTNYVYGNRVVTIDEDGNIYIGFQVKHDGNVYGAVCKLDSNGNKVWWAESSEFGNSWYRFLCGIAISGDNVILILESATEGYYLSFDKSNGSLVSQIERYEGVYGDTTYYEEPVINPRVDSDGYLYIGNAGYEYTTIIHVDNALSNFSEYNILSIGLFHSGELYYEPYPTYIALNDQNILACWQDEYWNEEYVALIDKSDMSVIWHKKYNFRRTKSALIFGDYVYLLISSNLYCLNKSDGSLVNSVTGVTSLISADQSGNIYVGVGTEFRKYTPDLSSYEVIYTFDDNVVGLPILMTTQGTQAFVVEIRNEVNSMYEVL